MKLKDTLSNTCTNTFKTQDLTGLPAAQWQQYTDNASRFSTKWAHKMDEKGEAHSFWDKFLQIFNIRRRQFARHKARAKRTRSLHDLQGIRQLVTNTDMLKNLWLTQFHGLEIKPVSALMVSMLFNLPN